MNVIEILEYEHQLILGVLWVMQTRSPAIMDGRPTASEIGVVNFCTKFIGECHYAKEFEFFIKLLQTNRTSMFIGPVTSFNAEHQQLCRQISALTAAWKLEVEGHPSAKPRVAEYLNDYANLMRDHMQKENRFYEVVANVMADPDHLVIKEAFDQLDAKTLGPDGHDRYCRWAHTLAATHHDLRPCSVPR